MHRILSCLPPCSINRSMGVQRLFACLLTLCPPLLAAAPCVHLQAYLTVTDTQGASTTSSQVTITAQTCNLAPVAKLSGGALSMSCGGTVKLDGESGRSISVQALHSVQLLSSCRWRPSLPLLSVC